MTRSNRTIESTATVRPRESAPGFAEATVFHGGDVVLDPFLALTDFHMSRPTFAPHPHAGFSAVTYMFRDSEGSFRNRDSLGDESLIEPGALHWTQAGAGMMHEEIPIEQGVDCHGLQLFVNLRSEHKLAAPRAFHVSARDVPVVHHAPGVEVHVVVGEFEGAASPLSGLLTPVRLLDVDVAPSATAELAVDPAERVVFHVIAGSVELDGVLLTTESFVSLADDSALATVVTFTAGTEGATVLVLAGRPIDEPVLFRGPFCMDTPERLDDARQRFQGGGMGHLAPSF